MGRNPTPFGSEIVRLFLEGMSFKSVAETLGLTKGAVAGYINRHKVKRPEGFVLTRVPPTLRAKPIVVAKIEAPIHTKIEAPIQTEAEVPVVNRVPVDIEFARFDIMDWAGKTITPNVDFLTALKLVPTVSEDRFRFLMTKERQVTTTKMIVIPR